MSSVVPKINKYVGSSKNNKLLISLFKMTSKSLNCIESTKFIQFELNQQKLVGTDLKSTGIPKNIKTLKIKKKKIHKFYFLGIGMDSNQLKFKNKICINIV